MEQKSADELIPRALLGDDQAFAQLVKTYLPPLYNFVFLIVREKEMAEDVVQETFIKAWKNLKRFDQEKSFKTWLYTIAKNTAFDHLKKKKTVPFSLLTDGEGDDPPFVREPALGSDIIALLDQEQALLALDQALEMLPVLYRTLLVLVYREDFSLHEAALILDEPYNTVKSRHKRAVEKLRQILELHQGSILHPKIRSIRSTP